MNWSYGITTVPARRGVGGRTMTKSCEQIAREMVDELPDHRPLSAGEVVEIANMVDAVLYALRQTHYGGTHGGMSEAECRTVHDRVLKLCPRLNNAPCGES